MNLFKASAIAVLVQLCAYQVVAQVEIPVNMYTGTPSISVPIWNLTSQDISVPVELSYDANAARGNSQFGSGWSLSTSGSITRELRSFPDDVGYTATKKGWLFTSGSGSPSDIASWNPAADFSSVYDAGEATDYTKLNGFNYNVDTEPDIFHYSCNGMSGSFVIGNDLQIHTIPYQDVKIVMNQNSTTKVIESFTITTNTGYVYNFTYKLVADRHSIETIYGDRAAYTTTELELFKNGVSFTHEWKLTSIVSPEGASVTFTYVSGTGGGGSGGREIALYEWPDPFYADPVNIRIHSIYELGSGGPSANVSTITASSGSKVEFVYGGVSSGTLTKIKISDDRRGTTDAEKFVKSFNFSYFPVYSYYVASWGSAEVAGTTMFLSSVAEISGCERIPPQTFTYYGLTHFDAVNNNPEGYYLPLTGTGIDLWGFPNGVSTNPHLFPTLYIYPDEKPAHRYRTLPISPHAGAQYIIEGANRQSSTFAMLPGTLQTITSPEGGVTTFRFEGNQYIDTKTNQSVGAGGLRIQSIEYFDGINPTPVKKTFEYQQGQLIRKPALAMPAYKWKTAWTDDRYDLTFQSPDADASYRTWHFTDERKWQYLTVRTAVDISPGERTQGSIVGYKIVTVRRPGAGSARYEYDVPAVYGDSVAGANNEWQATRNRFARSSSSLNMGVVKYGGQWSFPFTPNPEFDYERGLPLKKTEFDETGKIVRETITEYQRVYKTGSSATQVWGVKYDHYAGTVASDRIFFYGKYYLLTDVQKVPKKETIKTYDASGTDYIAESIEYVYGSTTHKLLSKVKRTTSEGNVYSTYIKYPLDYFKATSGSTDAVAIGTLQTMDRNGIPIEQIQILKRAGNNTPKVVSGSVIKLDPMGLGYPVLRSTWQLKANPPIDSATFYNSAVVNSSGYKFKIDARYEKTDSIVSYTSQGNVKETWSPISRKFSSIGYGFNSTVPTVQIASAKTENVAFSDFETTTGLEFSSTASYFGSGHTGAKGFHPSVVLTKTVTKAALVSNYILSFWLKSNQALVFNVTFKNGSSTVYSDTISRSSTSSQYKFVQKVFSVTGLPSTFIVELKANNLSFPTSPAAGGYDVNLLPVIDDIYFYPENADLVSSTYTIPFGASSVTSSIGNTAYTEYDKLGRLRFVYDKNKDIVKRNVYIYNTSSPLVADFSLPYPYTATVGVAATINAVTNDCVTDATYEWDWGSGFVSGAATQTRTFSTLGTAIVKLRVTSPTYGTKTITKSIVVVTSPFVIDICAEGATYFLSGLPDVVNDCPLTATHPLITTTSVTFYVNASVSVTSYQWMRRDLGATTWVNVGGNYASYDVGGAKFDNEHPTRSYEVKCQITSPLGIGFSPVSQVIYEP
jgi:hypothetical protein